jgi:hypothetical protein
MGLDDDDKIQSRSLKHNWDVEVAKSVCSTPPEMLFQIQRPSEYVRRPTTKQ